MQAAATAAGLPSRLGKYELLLPLAAGGMARIYIGRSTGIGSFERHVVLKMITPERANDLTAVNMFLDEARLAASLNHQNVAQVFEVGEDAGIHYLAMEYVHGQDLRAVLAKAGSQGTRIPLDLALTVVAGAAAGLHHAHERRSPDGQPLGIVHRDVSPSNIMIGYDGAVKLLDFGIAKATARSVETQSGIIKGKFAYMAPEQCRGRDVDRRSDVFSLGIILYEISTQHRCFRADSDFDTMHRIVTGDVVRPTRLVQGYPQALEAIVMKALAVDSAQRYQSSGMLLEALESFAVSARMSLSTMGLGRFMRDMFGEVQEPWLNTAATGLLQEVPKENTISSTNSKSAPMQPLSDSDVIDVNESAIPDDGRFPDSNSMQAAKTLLDLPREPVRRDPEGYGSQPPLAVGRNPAPDAPLTLDEPMPLTPGFASGHPTPPLPPRRSSQLRVPALGTTEPATRPGPSAQFASVGTDSGPAIMPLPLANPPPIVSTKHGYASGGMNTGGEAAYAPHVPASDPLLAADLQLKPSRRGLYIGLAIVLVGIGAIAFVMFGGKDEPSPVGDKTEDTAEPVAGGSADPGTSGSDMDESMVSVVIHSEPAGADVLIAGTKVGTTPFEKPLKRGTKIAPLTVHKDGYADFVGKIDLGGEYENRNIKLAPVGEGSASPSGSAAPTVTKPEAGKGKVDAEAAPSEATDKASGAKTPPKPTAATTTTTKSTVSKPTTGKSSEKASSEKSNEKASSEKASSEKTGDKASEKASDKSGDKSTKATTKPKEPACQPPGPNLDPYGPPVCKS